MGELGILRKPHWSLLHGLSEDADDRAEGKVGFEFGWRLPNGVGLLYSVIYGTDWVNGVSIDRSFVPIYWVRAGAPNTAWSTLSTGIALSNIRVDMYPGTLSHIGLGVRTSIIQYVAADLCTAERIQGMLTELSGIPPRADYAKS